MTTLEEKEIIDQFFGQPENFAEMMNVGMYHGEIVILPEMVKECDEAICDIVDEEIHFREKLSVIKLVNDGKTERVVILEIIQGEGKFVIMTHPNNFIH